jgi:hypothetical protein
VGLCDALSVSNVDASGNKLNKLVKSGGAIQYTQHYISTALNAGTSGIEYRQAATGTPLIEAIYHPEGRVFCTTSTASAIIWVTQESLFLI